MLVPINRCDFSNEPVFSYYNEGAIGKKIPKLFYSANKETDSNFDLPIAETFNEGEDACYSGKILNCFGKTLIFFFEFTHI